jgi:hypothetical protein
MTITFRKSFAAALLSASVAAAVPVIALAQSGSGASGSAGATGTATPTGTMTRTPGAQPANGANSAAGANAAGAASTSSGQSMSAPNSTATGTYGGMGTDQTKTINNDVNKTKQKATSPLNDVTTQPH